MLEQIFFFLAGWATIKGEPTSPHPKKNKTLSQNRFKKCRQLNRVNLVKMIIHGKPPPTQCMSCMISLSVHPLYGTRVTKRFKTSCLFIIALALELPESIPKIILEASTSIWIFFHPWSLTILFAIDFFKDWIKTFIVMLQLKTYQKKSLNNLLLFPWPQILIPSSQS